MKKCEEKIAGALFSHQKSILAKLHGEEKGQIEEKTLTAV